MIDYGAHRIINQNPLSFRCCARDTGEITLSDPQLIVGPGHDLVATFQTYPAEIDLIFCNVRFMCTPATSVISLEVSSLRPVGWDVYEPFCARLSDENELEDLWNLWSYERGRLRPKTDVRIKHLARIERRRMRWAPEQVCNICHLDESRSCKHSC